MLKVVPDKLAFLAAVQATGDYIDERVWDNEYFPDDINGLASELMGRDYPDGDWNDEIEAYEDERAHIVGALWQAWVTCEYHRLTDEEN